MSDVGNVTAAKPAVGGAVYVATVGTTLPTDAVTAIGTDFVCLGYISEDGLTSNNNITTETIKAWGGDEVLVTNQGRTDEISFTLIEGLNPDVLKEAFGDDNVSGTLSTGITVNVNSDTMAEKAMIVDMVMRNDALKRLCYPRASVTNVAEVSYGDNSAVGYAMTYKAMADDDGQTHYEYIVAATTEG